jgi:hypothetical protein
LDPLVLQRYSSELVGFYQLIGAFIRQLGSSFVHRFATAASRTLTKGEDEGIAKKRQSNQWFKFGSDFQVE